MFKNARLSLVLYTGCPPGSDIKQEDYPIIVTPDEDPNAKVLVIQNTIWGKFLGRLNVMFNHDGNISEWYGNPILMDNSTAEGKQILIFLIPPSSFHLSLLYVMPFNTMI